MSKKVSPQFEEKPNAEQAEDVGCAPQVNDRFLVHLP